MDIVKAAGNVRFKLDHELDLKSTVWLAFIEDVKRMVPSDSRSYNKQTTEWTVTEEWWPTIQELRKKHFSDPNQLDLLGE